MSYRKSVNLGHLAERPGAAVTAPRVRPHEIPLRGARRARDFVITPSG